MIPNRPAYRMNPKEQEELRRQVGTDLVPYVNSSTYSFEGEQRGEQIRQLHQQVVDMIAKPNEKY